MNLFVDNDIDLSKYFVATYYVGSTKDLARAAWDIAVGQSVGNPNVRSVWETDTLFENHSCKILHKEEYLKGRDIGIVKIAFPNANINWEEDGISQLLCHLMGGQMDIDHIVMCQLREIDLSLEAQKQIRLSNKGISGIRAFTKQYRKPLLGGIVKPKTGLDEDQLVRMVEELVIGGVDFIKEDEILGDISSCRLVKRIEKVSKKLQELGRPVVYCACINSDPISALEKAKVVNDLGGNGVHINFWSGLGIYSSLRKEHNSLFIHFQKSGDKVITGKKNPYRIDWSVICYLAGLMGVDTIHAGMYGGYLQDDTVELSNTLNILHKYNVMPALSCGMHPGLIDRITRIFGYEYMANVGGAIHGHPGGTLAGVKAMRQAIDGNRSKEYEQAIEKWGYLC